MLKKNHGRKLYDLMMAIGFVAIFIQPAITAATDKIKLPAQRGSYSGAMVTEYPAWFNDGFLDFRDDITAAKTAGKQLIILFTQDGCPYCNALVERNLAQKDIEELIRGKFMVDAINIVGDRRVTNMDGKIYTEKTFAEFMKVQFTPHTVIL